MADENNRDWPEDFDQENGEYQNECYLCHEIFVGNKHRVECKRCVTLQKVETIFDPNLRII